jgi:DNA-directed RNA polymerase specialized sigma24 family protein
MRDVEQYEFAEIAQILQMNETAIREHFQEQEKIRENIAKITVMELNRNSS